MCKIIVRGMFLRRRLKARRIITKIKSRIKKMFRKKRNKRRRRRRKKMKRRGRKKRVMKTLDSKTLVAFKKRSQKVESTDKSCLNR